MAEPLPTDEMIQRYVDGELSTAELEQFETAMAQQPALQQAVERARLAIQAVQYAAIASRVKAIHETAVPQNPAHQKNRGRLFLFGRKPLRTALAVAASLFVCLIGFAVLYLSQLSPEKLYAESFVAYSVSSSRGAEPTTTDALVQAYQRKDYKGVVAAAQGKGLSPEQQLLTGIAHLRLNEAPAAITVFKALLQAAPAAAFRQDAEYYLTLAYLKNKQYNEALPRMRAIHNNPDHLYHRQFTSGAIRDVQLLKWKA